ncbi:lysylphosphatidylglycerol synthase transmembrane domain-containing protein [Streptomyces decoyicus]|uniref:lysylphosphatidylglycerol synthase transmembrane domain-containing protein n=1 Tax=Streptomyces decoyicus TaxID=249567 RepID=UPI00069E4C94|nr:lysylphosphatidylglycerol synthase domain-containing protein [Streptomyces decoyicus]QZY16939.1 YbhN family protein [Streptomyces decoyicus]
MTRPTVRLPKSALRLPKSPVPLPRSALRLLGLLSSAAGLVVLALAVPRAAGTDWAAVRSHLGHISGPQVALMCGLAGAALWSYTYVLSAALPGLTLRQALWMNCTGSAVSNLLPLGGGAGVAVTYAMARGWGHPPRAVAVCVALTGVCNVAARLVLSAVGALLLAGTPVPGIGWAAAAGGVALVLPVAVAAAWPAVRHRRRAPGTHRRTAPAGAPGRLVRRARQSAARLRDESRDVVRRSWARLVCGMSATLGAQGALFLACLQATDSRTGTADALAVFAASRLLTQIAVTPGGIGVTECAAAVALVALGGAPTAVASAMLLFATFTHLLEIPLGALTGALWLLRAGRRRPAPAPAAP